MIHGNLSPAATDAVIRHKHSVHPLESAPVGLDELLKHAAMQQLDIITTDKYLAHRPLETKTRFNRAIVYLQLSGGDVEQDDAIDRLFARYKSPKPGMLYTVTETRVKVRQLPGL
jgi:hypothetical protein